MKEWLSNAIGFLLVMLILFYLKKCRDETLINARKYTVATITRVGGENDVFYQFYFKGKIVHGESYIPHDGYYHNVKRGQRYIVRFSEDYPSVSIIHFEMPLLKCKITPPNEGWNEIPNFSKLCE